MMPSIKEGTISPECPIHRVAMRNNCRTCNPAQAYTLNSPRLINDRISSAVDNEISSKGYKNPIISARRQFADWPINL